jgi:hypothetical protein
MSWCPVCKAEYRQDFNHCANCKVELVNILKPNPEDKGTIKTSESWVLLTEITNENEATIIESFLQSYEIALLKKYKGNGDMLKLYTGITSFGFELFVPQNQYEQAMKLLDSLSKPNVYQAIDNGSDWSEREIYNNKRRWMMSILLACFCIPLIVFLWMNLIVK